MGSKVIPERNGDMLKRFAGIFLTFVMIVSLASVYAEEALPGNEGGSGDVIFEDDEGGTTAAGDEAEYTGPSYSYEELVVGTSTPVEGNFFTGMWGNNASDMDIRNLLNAYNLVYWDRGQSMFIMNPASVSGMAVFDDAEGNRTFIISLYRDMKYSDGTAITARDYAFSFLLRISPLVGELGGKPLQLDFIEGYEAYVKGESSVLEGLQVLSDNELMITISSDFLPFFYELGLLECDPYPMHIIAPGCEIPVDGKGARIEGDFTVELLRKTIMDPETGYLFHPSVVSGPYILTSCEGHTVTLEANPFFKGDSDRVIPMIKKLKLVPVTDENMMDMLSSGQVGVLNKVVQADLINEGMNLKETGNYAFINYPRVGMTQISFSCEKLTVSSQAVRQALAYCLDKNQLILDYTGSYGLRVDGYYGLGQWIYQIVIGTRGNLVKEPEEDTEAARKAYEEEIAAWENLNMGSIPVYLLDVEKANSLLDRDGWTLNEEGEPRQEGEVRCKEIDGTLVPLRLKMAVGKGNNILESFEKHFKPYLKEAGVELELVVIEMDELLDEYYLRTERTVDMIYLGINFGVLFDPTPYFKPPTEKKQTSWNYTQIADEKLYQAALDLRRTEPGDIREYCTKWLYFQTCVMDSLPFIPIYSNVYFDYYTRVLHDYYPNESSEWSKGVISAFLGDPGDPPVEKSEEESGEDEIFFDE